MYANVDFQIIYCQRTGNIEVTSALPFNVDFLLNIIDKTKQ